MFNVSSIIGAWNQIFLYIACHNTLRVTFVQVLSLTFLLIACGLIERWLVIWCLFFIFATVKALWISARWPNKIIFSKIEVNCSCETFNPLVSRIFRISLRNWLSSMLYWLYLRLISCLLRVDDGILSLHPTKSKIFVDFLEIIAVIPLLKFWDIQKVKRS